jgi:hypothetical protein
MLSLGSPMLAAAQWPVRLGGAGVFVIPASK